MRNLFIATLFMLAACSKEDVSPALQHASAGTVKSLCITDYGIIVPCEDFEAWKDVDPASARGPKLKFHGETCTIQPGNIPGLKCKLTQQPDCLNEFECAPCGNCY